MSRITFLLLLTIFFSLFMFSVVYAADTSANQVVSLDNPLGGQTAENPAGNADLRFILGNLVNKVLGVLGAIALLVFVAGGAMWLTSGGNAEKVKNGSMAMMWAIIGLFVIFSSYAILNLVIKGLFAADTATSQISSQKPIEPSKCYCQGVDKDGKPDGKVVFVPYLESKDECEKSHADLKLTDCVWGGQSK